MPAILEADDLQIAYGDITAVWSMSLRLEPSTICALVGRNGAGKSTFLKGIAGLLPLKHGTIKLDGEEITDLPGYRRVSRGLAFVQEGKRVFRDMTVRENLLLGTFSKRARGKEEALIEEMCERFPALSPRLTEKAGRLSGGQQQMLAIAQALISQPQVLLLDEPSSGLAPVIVDELYEIIARLKREEIAIVLVEQQVEMVLGGIAERVVVVDGGRVVLDEVAANLTVDQLAAAADLT